MELIPAVPVIPLGDEVKYAIFPTFDSLVVDDNGVTLESKLNAYEYAGDNKGQIAINAEALIDDIKAFKPTL